MVEPDTSPASSAANPASKLPTNVRWHILILLMATAGFSHFNRISISSAGTEHIMQEYGIDKPSMGIVYSSYLFVYTFCMLPGGWLLDRIGPKRALMIVGIGSAILVPLTGLASYLLPGFVLLNLCLIRGMLGMITAPLHPSAARAVSFWMPSAGRGIANGMVTGAAVVGVALTPFLFGFLMDKLGWQQAFIAAGGATFLLAMAWTYYATDHPFQHPGANTAERQLLANDVPPTAQRLGIVEGLAGLAGLCRNRNLVLLTLSYAAYSYVQYLFFYWQQQYFKDVLKMTDQDSRLFTTIVNVAMVLGMLNGGWLADRLQLRYGTRRVRAMIPICGLLACAVLLLLGIASTNKIWVLCCFGLAMGALGVCEAPFWVTAVEFGGRLGGLSGAFLNTIGNVGGILVPVITPLVGKYFGWQAALGLASTAAVVGAVIWLWIDLRENQESERLHQTT